MARNCQLYTKGLFKENNPVNLSIRALIIVPIKIICALVILEHENPDFKSENEFAHITMMKGQWKPVQSNDILKALFNKSYGLKKDLYSQLMGDECPKGY